MHLLTGEVYRSPQDRARDRIAWLRRGAWIAAAVGLVLLLDRPLFLLLSHLPPIGGDLHRFIRQLGSLWIWLAVFCLLTLHDRWRLHAAGVDPWRPARHAQGPAAMHRGGLILLSAVLAGAIAELLKVSLRMSRPSPLVLGPESGDGTPAVLVEAGSRLWLWLEPQRELAGDLGIGMASSHTAVAFGALAVVARLMPGTAPVVFALAALCGLSRVLDGAHFVSDVLVGGLIGWLTASVLVRATEPRRAERPLVPAV